MLEAIKSAIVKLQGFSLSQEQSDNIAIIYDAILKHGIKRKRHISYIMATIFHEAARLDDIAGKKQYRRIVCVEEIGKGNGKPYGEKIKYNKKPYSRPAKIYYGRGFVQITWYEVYELFGKVLNIDLLGNPELALDPYIAAEIAVIGMKKGYFTGVNLERYFNDTSTDYVNARSIINNLDKAHIIGGYYKIILMSITNI